MQKAGTDADGADRYFDGPAHAGAFRQPGNGDHRHPEVLECLLITGQQSDYQLKVVVRDMDGYQDLLLSKITRITGVTGVHTSFVLRKGDRAEPACRCRRCHPGRCPAYNPPRKVGRAQSLGTQVPGGKSGLHWAGCQLTAGCYTVARPKARKVQQRIDRRWRRKAHR